MLSVIYLGLEGLKPNSEEPELVEMEKPRRRRPLVDSFDGTYVPSASALEEKKEKSWVHDMWIKLFQPEKLQKCNDS